MERLEKFERMLSDIKEKFDDVNAQLEKLRSENKVKTATYRQLLGRKMTYQTLLDLYKYYDLVD